MEVESKTIQNGSVRSEERDHIEFSQGAIGITSEEKPEKDLTNEIQATGKILVRNRRKKSEYGTPMVKS